MKTAIKHTIITLVFVVGTFAADAQVKIGSNPTVASPTSNLEVEGTVGGNISKVAVTKDSSKVGIGTIAPNNKLEINSGKTNKSGLRLTNLTTATPITTGALSIGVTANGDVVSVGPTLESVAIGTSSGNTSVPASIATKLNFGTTSINRGNNFDLTTDTYTAPSAGIYFAKVVANFPAIGVNNQLFGSIFKNGANYQSLWINGGVAAGTGAVESGSLILFLNAGDTIDFRVASNIATTATGSFEVYKLGN